jgi:pyridoxamine 5'-phosphate oxidase
MVPDSNPGDSPYQALNSWYQEAISTEPRVPDAMQLATADKQGVPSIRTVLLKAFGPDEGFVFFTNYNSRKSLQIQENPKAAVCLHWKDLKRQVIAEGSVEKLDLQASQAYFTTRNRESQIGAWASAQSETLGARQTLVDKVTTLTERFAGEAIPCPPHWGGYRLIPHRIEFWQDIESRLHHRVLFEWTEGTWRRRLLQP